MKITEALRWFAMVTIVITMTSCEKRVVTESVVSPEGEIDRTITYEQDTSAIVENVFGLSQGNGWTSAVEAVEIPEDDNVKRTNNIRYRVTFKKHYNSANEANAELDKESAQHFRIRSAFETNFRWFYTYTRYSDTYKSLNRFENFPRDSFFTKEDISFIRRMPAEGRQISKADSIYLDQLTEKIGTYFTMGVFEKHFEMVVNAAKEKNIPKNWIDSLYSYKGAMYSRVVKEEFEPENDKEFMLPLIESFKFGFPTQELEPLYHQSVVKIQPVVDFMTTVAGEMHFQHRIQMPGEVVASNADSLAGNTVVWNPMTMKFMLEDFTMEAESRKINYWSLAVTAVFIGVTAWLWSRQKRMPVA